MYRYMPPKSSIWGHSLRKMPAARERALFQTFLDDAVAEFTLQPAGLMIVGDPRCELRQRFQRLLKFESPTDYSLLNAEQFDICLQELLANPEIAASNTIQLLLTQPYRITKWRIEAQEIATDSLILLYFGSRPIISTTLYFDTVEQYQYIKRVFETIGLCKLNDKHLKLMHGCNR